MSLEYREGIQARILEMLIIVTLRNVKNIYPESLTDFWCNVSDTVEFFHPTLKVTSEVENVIGVFL